MHKGLGKHRAYLVTGGLGFMGVALVEALHAAGHHVRVLDDCSRGSVGRLQQLAQDIEIVEGDVRDPAIVYRCVYGVDSVVHLAFINGTRHFYERPHDVLEVGVKGIINVIDSCIRADIGELVVASSSEVYQTPETIPTSEDVPLSVPDPLNPRYSYGGAKIITELMAINYGRRYFDRVLIFRPHNVYGPDMGWEHVIPQFITRLKSHVGDPKSEEHLFPVQGTGEQTRSFAYIDDCIAGVIKMMDKGEHLNIYNIGSVEEVTIGDLAREISGQMGIRIRVVSGPPAAGSTSRRCPDIRKLQALGYSPRFSLRDGLSPTIRWYLAHTKPSEADRLAWWG